MPQRPTTTVIIPGRDVLDQILNALIEFGEIFTVEPSQTQPGQVWHVGVMNSGAQVITRHFGALRDVGTVGEFRID